MRGVPQDRFSEAIRPMSWRTSGSMRGRPGFPLRDFHRQYLLNPARCQRTTVSGITKISASDQCGHIRLRKTQNARLNGVSLGRGLATLQHGELLP